MPWRRAFSWPARLRAVPGAIYAGPQWFIKPRRRPVNHCFYWGRLEGNLLGVLGVGWANPAFTHVQEFLRPWRLVSKPERVVAVRTGVDESPLLDKGAVTFPGDEGEAC